MRCDEFRRQALLATEKARAEATSSLRLADSVRLQSEEIEHLVRFCRRCSAAAVRCRG